MNYVHLSPYFPPNYLHFTKALKTEGIRVLGLGDMPYDDLHPDLKSALTDYYRVDNLHQYNQLVRAMGYFTHQYGKIDGIDSHNEYWLETEAMLRADFNIVGLKPEDMIHMKKKSEMKKVFRAAGLHVAEGMVVADWESLLQFANKNGYPLIAKPDNGVGASGTYKIFNETDLRSFFDKKPANEYFIEQFIEGIIESFDGLVDLKGDLLFSTSHINERGVMEVVNEDTHVYFYNLREIPQDIEEAGKRALKAFQLKGRFFHIEFFREQQSNKLFALEVNMRPPGGYTMDMFNFSVDADLYQLWASMVSGKEVSFNYERKFHVCFVSRKNRHHYQFTQHELLQKYPQQIAFHGAIPDVMSPAMGNYCFLVRTSDLQEMFEVQKAIHQLK